MNHANSADKSADERKLVSSFEEIRRTLLQDTSHNRLDRPLVYWTLPKDRQLPLAFLNRSIRELLETPYRELTATKGIGKKKISSLVKLLHRASADTLPAIPYGMRELAEELESRRAESSNRFANHAFDPEMVSEAIWVQWCETARRFGLGNEKLGRLAPTLKTIPTGLWETPLREYMFLGIDEIRRLPTHGAKRIRALLEIFHAVHELLSSASEETHLTVRLAPRFIQEVEQWVALQLHCRERPQRKDVERFLGEPILEQVRCDTSDSVRDLVQNRLGIGVPAKSVREQSREAGISRARIYQLMVECETVMEIRWSEGRRLLTDVLNTLVQGGADGDGVRLIKQILDLFFPAKSKPGYSIDKIQSGVGSREVQRHSVSATDRYAKGPSN